MALILDDILVIVTLIIGYLIWWLIVLGRGQTPGKQLLGIWAIKTTGERSGWSNTFLREFVFKGLVFGWLGAITGYVAYALDYLWALWDRDTQTLHDKLADTVVVRGVSRPCVLKSEGTR